MRQLMQRLMAKFDPGCASISRTVSVSLDRPLSLKERWQISLHMVICNFCRRYSRQLLAVKNLVSTLDQEELCAGTEPALSEQARERIRKSFESSPNL